MRINAEISDDAVIVTASRLMALQRAAQLALDTLANLTSHEFARGQDRPARIALAEALDLDPRHYCL